MRQFGLDATRVAERVCNNALQLASISERPDPGQSLQAVIDWIKNLSAQAAGHLRETLAIDYPEIGWAEEDLVNAQDRRPYWLYDPIDGAYHFLQGLPLWSSSLALIVDGEPVFSVVHDTSQRDTFVAQKGGGAICNGRPVTVSRKQDPATAVLGTSIPPLAQVGPKARDRALALVKLASDSAFVIRPMAAVSLQLAYVAAGRLDGFWEVGDDPGDWLAGSLLVTEAGGQVTTLAGGEVATGEGVLAGPPAIHRHLLNAFRKD
ncbi:inositol monophosphatase family protein [Caulobacter sp. CCH9-E1]|jgi:myo-inositol-1(or 4)-monophosphatase|uniref:inositol monophosphatase family protein n=1 Tax=Caulobacter sp. CCH9-E1 TaxID=1768768 RepID=UPI00082A3385|nr:inositol monophosphatase family protein [Caulobacter sp. CCH9-E1]